MSLNIRTFAKRERNCNIVHIVLRKHYKPIKILGFVYTETGLFTQSNPSLRLIYINFEFLHNLFELYRHIIVVPQWLDNIYGHYLYQKVNLNIVPRNRLLNQRLIQNTSTFDINRVYRTKKKFYSGDAVLRAWLRIKYRKAFSTRKNLNGLFFKKKL